MQDAVADTARIVARPQMTACIGCVDSSCTQHQQHGSNSLPRSCEEAADDACLLPILVLPLLLPPQADHAFQPNCYSPHCSDGKSDMSIVALLQVWYSSSGPCQQVAAATTVVTPMRQHRQQLFRKHVAWQASWAACLPGFLQVAAQHINALPARDVAAVHCCLRYAFPLIPHYTC